MSTMLTDLPQKIMLSQLLCAVIERVLNKSLVLHTNEINGDLPLAALEQKTLTLTLNELSNPISLTVHHKRVLVTSLTDNSDCTIATSIATLRELRAEQALTQLIKEGKLDVIGDIKVAQQFAQVADKLSIDWQSELATHIGDIPTHKLVSVSQKLKAKLASVSNTLHTDVSEYLVHEKGLAVCASEINTFNQAVSDITLQTQAVEKRIAALLQRLK